MKKMGLFLAAMLLCIGGLSACQSAQTPQSSATPQVTQSPGSTPEATPDSQATPGIEPSPDVVMPQATQVTNTESSSDAVKTIALQLPVNAQMLATTFYEQEAWAMVLEDPATAKVQVARVNKATGKLEEVVATFESYEANAEYQLVADGSYLLWMERKPTAYRVFAYSRATKKTTMIYSGLGWAKGDYLVPPALYEGKAYLIDAKDIQDPKGPLVLKACNLETLEIAVMWTIQARVNSHPLMALNGKILVADTVAYKPGLWLYDVKTEKAAWISTGTEVAGGYSDGELSVFTQSYWLPTVSPSPTPTATPDASASASPSASPAKTPEKSPVGAQRMMIYDKATNKLWQTLWARGQATIADGKVYGFPVEKSGDVMLRKMEQFDPKTGKMVRLFASIPANISLLQPNQVADGKWVFGVVTTRDATHLMNQYYLLSR